MLSQATTPDTLRLLGCIVGGRTYGLDAAWVLSIQRTERLQPTDDDAAMVGRLGDLPVYSLARQLGVTAQTRSSSQQVAVLDTGSGPWGLLLDRVTPLPPIAATALEPIPPRATQPETDCWLGAVQLEQEVLLVLDAERLHPDADRPPRWHEPSQRPAPTLMPGVAPQPRVGGERQLVLFSTLAMPAGQRPVSFGLSLAHVAEICEPLPVVPVPAAPAGVAGLVRWREHLVAVVDLAHLLGLPAVVPEKRMRLLIARTPGPSGLLGFLVRPGIRVLRLPVASVPSPRLLPVDLSRVRAVVELEGETLIVPDLNSLE
jgi:chemotaxis signal transduction protein